MKQINIQVWDGYNLGSMITLERAWGLGYLKIVDNELRSNYEHVKLRRYTGLLDDHGKEIYQGDIVGEPGFGYPVEFHDGRFTILNAQSLIEFLNTRHKRQEPTEVIGNIYEQGEYR